MDDVTQAIQNWIDLIDPEFLLAILSAVIAASSLRFVQHFTQKLLNNTAKHTETILIEFLENILRGVVRSSVDKSSINDSIKLLNTLLLALANAIIAHRKAYKTPRRNAYWTIIFLSVIILAATFISELFANGVPELKTTNIVFAAILTSMIVQTYRQIHELEKSEIARLTTNWIALRRADTTIRKTCTQEGAPKAGKTRDEINSALLEAQHVTENLIGINVDVDTNLRTSLNNLDGTSASNFQALNFNSLISALEDEVEYTADALSKLRQHVRRQGNNL